MILFIALFVGCTVLSGAGCAFLVYRMMPEYLREEWVRNWRGAPGELTHYTEKHYSYEQGYRDGLGVKDRAEDDLLSALNENWQDGYVRGLAAGRADRAYHDDPDPLGLGADRQPNGVGGPVGLGVAE